MLERYISTYLMSTASYILITAPVQLNKRAWIFICISTLSTESSLTGRELLFETEQPISLKNK